MRKYILISLSIIIISFSFFVGTSLAGPLNDPNEVVGGESLMGKFAKSSGFNIGDSDGAELGEIISIVIKAFLGLLAIIFIILMIYAGFIWMTAGGEEQKVTTAKETIKKAIIGLVIIVSAYAITAFVFKALPFGDSKGDAGGGTGGSLPPG
ncbi:MAG: hypothetical protein US83_C0010G0045 [Candidatus Falkowbacteria bacterium GW2011_GWC2_38_22]|uniref:Uncharacterized protein n=1 Tax=Candidatus Falkowbacteria bacterium GW2011_GWE1_38_31 TaxID=1618638 RepID=A0A0G0M984_9BACT|nr:MAG: hypothetical protein US73_C0005G0045 [Candidatus Falkowbacteria bacterium GW2011_GWF2_38_1205]KKQ61011.1 MAG: hypothetical protein US83_C0010G0045 [Candidatus Falkowbacteria bacterium GW2011_GWC2_38_22]KKQ63460.1 MAG: hypothetical protein US84_C0006G0063 [Candidatus Falkowbacteria bacterium GW2011_GWF1_38_22]KKQ65469.1 MAG: hypothetical protein US87_C0007G0045 [Candidatus Falkowbacteria bacterium GW2011_GWE2_38_254]KKQ70224.1 MAG: hypothetical protein US91_C0006G0063 [Candidatus Falkowb